MDFDFDITVVGAGLAGLEAARRLAQRGHRVLLLDMKQAPDRGIHTTGIFVRRTLADFALPEECLGPPVRRVVLHSPSDRRTELTSEHDEFRVGRMGLLYRWWLQECERAGAEWSGATRMASVSPIAGGSAVWLERGGRRWRVRTRVLIGADGAVSRVARYLGLDQNREFLVGVEDVYEGSVGDAPSAFDCYLDPRLAPGYIGWWIHDGEATHVGVAGYAARFQPNVALAELKRRVAARGGLPCDRAAERRGGRIPVSGVLRRIGCARGLLVGDAAGAVSPLTAGGLDGCLRLTAYAVAVAGTALEAGPLSSLAMYSGDVFQHRFVSRRFLRRLIRLVRQPWLAETACLALRHQPLRALAWHIFFGRGSFPDVEPIVPQTFSAGDQRASMPV